MQKVKLMLAAVLCMYLGTGCITLPDSYKERLTPTNLGRDITVAYLLNKKRLEQDHIDTIKQVYDLFGNALDGVEGGDFSKFKDLLIGLIDKNIKKPEHRALATALVHRYWGRLVDKFNVDKLQGKEAYTVLSDFRDGIESAKADYSYLIEKTPEPKTLPPAEKPKEKPADPPKETKPDAPKDGTE